MAPVAGEDQVKPREAVGGRVRVEEELVRRRSEYTAYSDEALANVSSAVEESPRLQAPRR